MSTVRERMEPQALKASDLDPDFLESIGRDGVLLYQRDGFTRPAPLQSLEPFAQWEARAPTSRLAHMTPRRTVRESLAVPASSTRLGGLTIYTSMVRRGMRPAHPLSIRKGVRWTPISYALP
jgi:hypothetical protein